MASLGECAVRVVAGVMAFRSALVQGGRGRGLAYAGVA